MRPVSLYRATVKEMQSGTESTYVVPAVSLRDANNKALFAIRKRQNRTGKSGLKLIGIALEGECMELPGANGHSLKGGLSGGASA